MTRLVKNLMFFSMMAFAVNAEKIDLFILAGQSNAQGWQGNAQFYPEDPEGLDRTIRFYWFTPRFSNSGGKWTTMQSQKGRFKMGHFGLEVSFARELKKAGYNPAIFKYSLGATSLAGSWRLPGQGGLYDKMKKEFAHAVQLLKDQGHEVRMSGFIWIQGENDAQNARMAAAYKGRLKIVLDDLRKNMTKCENLPLILGVDEQHSWVKKNPRIVTSLQELAREEPCSTYTTMLGLEKADRTHLKPAALVEQGKRVFNDYRKLMSRKR